MGNGVNQGIDRRQGMPLVRRRVGVWTDEWVWECCNVGHMGDTFTVVSSKGQIVIPAVLREKLGIKTGTRMAIRSEENQLILQPINDEFIRSLVGRYKGKGSLVEARELDHKRDERLKSQKLRGKG
jgi:AbrB family looped-hinge helix DNA binding protein